MVESRDIVLTCTRRRRPAGRCGLNQHVGTVCLVPASEIVADCVVLPGSATFEQVPPLLVKDAHVGKGGVQMGITSTVIQLPEGCTQQDLNSAVDTACANPLTDGVLVQLPLPPHLDEYSVMERLHPQKDVDGFHPLNMGRMLARGVPPRFVPATALGCMELLERYGINVKVRACGHPYSALLCGAPTGEPRFSSTALFHKLELSCTCLATQKCHHKITALSARPCLSCCLCTWRPYNEGI